jgi:ATP-dependent DNA helicase RecQ
MVEAFMRRRDDDRRRLDAIVAYASTGRCRWHVLLEYLGEAAPEGGCGRCDNCRNAVQRDADRASRPEFIKPKPVDVRFLRGRLVDVEGAGRGVIEAVEDDRIAVRFPGAGMRWVSKSDVAAS